MKRMALFALVAGAAVLPLVGWSVTIDVTKVQQRYPWNGLVDIDYTITRAANEAGLNPDLYAVAFSVVDCEAKFAVTNVARTFLQAQLPVAAGSHRVTWNANADGFVFASKNVEVIASLVHYLESYLVIDVSGGAAAEVYPVTYLHEAPPGDGFNTDEYKGGKIVLRKIPAGTFQMGSPTTEPGRSATAGREELHTVTLTKPFYIGVFEITQAQYQNVMGVTTFEYVGLYHPAENLAYNDAIRGETDVVSYTFLGKLRAKAREFNPQTGRYDLAVAGLFDLPTEAQWEYACRAGTTSAYNNGGNTENDLKEVGCYNSDHHAVVGSYPPNAWGLYDMHGNVWEWCRDWWCLKVMEIPHCGEDPVGPDSGEQRDKRGGGYTAKTNYSYCRSAFRNASSPTAKSGDLGFRLSLEVLPRPEGGEDEPVAEKPVLIFNEDPDNVMRAFWHADPAHYTAQELSNYVNSVIGGGYVTHFFACVNVRVSAYPSQVAPNYWAALELQGYNQPQWLYSMKDLVETRGVDQFKLYFDLCRDKGVSPWISVRMNDIHSVNDPKAVWNVGFWKEHPELWINPDMSNRNDCADSEKAFDYCKQGVRDHMLAYIDEALGRYDVDGIELDWMRFEYHCPRAVARTDGAAAINAFMRAVRELVDGYAARRGHPILIAGRVDTEPEAALNHGTDYQTWARDGLVDWIIPCNFWTTVDFELPLAKWTNELAELNPKVKVYPGLDCGVQLSGKARRLLTASEYAGWADRMYERGAKGLYVFNLFCHPMAASGAVWEPWNYVLGGGLTPEGVANHEKTIPANALRECILSGWYTP